MEQVQETGVPQGRGSYTKPKRSPEEIVARKIKQVENPLAMVIAPKTREGHILVKTLFGFDRAVNQIRMKAGTFLAMKESMEQLKKAAAPIEDIEKIAKALGGSGNGGNGYGYAAREGLAERQMLAARKTTYVFLPRTEEGRLIADGIKKLDPLLLEFRTKCMDFTKSKTVFSDILALVSEFDKTTASLCAFAGVEYEQPKVGGLQEKVG